MGEGLLTKSRDNSKEDISLIISHQHGWRLQKTEPLELSKQLTSPIHILSFSNGADCSLHPQKLFTPFYYVGQGPQEPSKVLFSHTCDPNLSFWNRDFNLRESCHSEEHAKQQFYIISFSQLMYKSITNVNH